MSGRLSIVAICNCIYWPLGQARSAGTDQSSAEAATVVRVVPVVLLVGQVGNGDIWLQHYAPNVASDEDKDKHEDEDEDEESVYF
ncbi:GH12266 [Drosophila grimshawi]|uniref:GH12266 n=1 Tax=Drosophila grimshawi TaxID=7222 RepID=B4JJF1_DROGR|nr:GH12266 [Drosophila grimshawi]